MLPFTLYRGKIIVITSGNRAGGIVIGREGISTDWESEGLTIPVTEVVFESAEALQGQLSSAALLFGRSGVLGGCS